MGDAAPPGYVAGLTDRASDLPRRQAAERELFVGICRNPDGPEVTMRCERCNDLRRPVR
jgi:hypothetical protein